MNQPKTDEEKDAYRRKLIDYAWQTGQLSYKLHAGQKIVHTAFTENKKKLFVANCSRQWGKSFVCVTYAIETAIKTPNARIYYATGYMKDLHQFIVPTFNTILDDCPYRFKPDFKYNNKYIFPNGSEIYLTGLDKHPDGPRGNTLDLIILDEAAYMENLEYLVKSVFGPATLHRPNAKIIMISTPPESTNHAFNDFCNRAKLEGNYQTFTIYQNPMLTQEAIEAECENQGGKDSTTWRREFMCEIVSEESKMIIPEWNTVNHECVKPILPLEDQFYSYHQKYIGMDVGVKDFTAGVFAHYSFPDSTLYVEDEFILKNREVTPSNIAKIIKEKRIKLWGANTKYRGISDNDALLINALYQEHRESFNAVAKKSKIEMVQRVRTMVKSKQIIIDPRCQMLIMCLESGVWDAGSLKTQEFKDFARSKSLGHFDHLDALIYLVMSLDRRTNPIPPLFGVDMTNKIMKDPNKYRNISDSVKKFAKSIVPLSKR